MIDFLLNTMLWWHWIIFGMVLVVSEIIVPLFVIIWFGLAAIIVGFIDLALDTSFSQEIALWTLLSVVLLFLWFRFFKGRSITESGQSDFRLNTKGIVIEKIPHGGRGRVRFESPVLGDSEWQATSDEDLDIGSIVHIVDVNGQLLKVKKDK